MLLAKFFSSCIMVTDSLSTTAQPVILSCCKNSIFFTQEHNPTTNYSLFQQMTTTYTL